MKEACLAFTRNCAPDFRLGFVTHMLHTNKGIMWWWLKESRVPNIWIWNNFLRIQLEILCWRKRERGFKTLDSEVCCKSLMSWLYLVRTGWIIVTFTLSLWSMPDWIQWLSSCAESWVSLWGLHLLFSGFFERKPQSRKSSDQKVSESPHTSRLKCPNLHHLKAYLQPSTKRFGLNSFIVFHSFNKVVVVLGFFTIFYKHAIITRSNCNCVYVYVCHVLW